MAHAQSSAAKRSAMRAAPEEDPEFQIAPMIDILLVLLVFFMSISSTEVLQSNQAVKLPVAKDAKEKEPGGKNKGQAIVNVLWNETNGSGAIDIDDKSYGLSDIVPAIQQRVTANPDMRVLIRADKSVRYEFLRGVLKSMGEAGVANVTFSVVDKEAGAPAASPAP